VREAAPVEAVYEAPYRALEMPAVPAAVPAALAESAPPVPQSAPVPQAIEEAPRVKPALPLAEIAQELGNAGLVMIETRHAAMQVGPEPAVPLGRPRRVRERAINDSLEQVETRK